MHIRWFGHACFLTTEAGTAVLVDPFDGRRASARRGLRFDYPPLPPLKPDLVLVTHGHLDHDGASTLDPICPVLRTPGQYQQSGVSVHAITADHDEVGGREMGETLILSWHQGATRCCHLGDCGQAFLRGPQVAAIGRPHVLFIPVGGPPTLGPRQAVRCIQALQPQVAIPMHYRTAAINFLQPLEPFLEVAAGRFTICQAATDAIDIQPEATWQTTTIQVLAAPCHAPEPDPAACPD